MSEDEITPETDIDDLYALSLSIQEAEERNGILVSLTYHLTVLGLNHYYLEKMSQNIFKAKTADIDNKKLLYLKKLLEDRANKLTQDKIKTKENTKRKH